MVTPSPAVLPALNQALDVWIESARIALEAGDAPVLQPLGSLSTAVHALEQDPATLSGEERDLYNLVAASPFARRNVRAILIDLLHSDQHLTSACRSPWGLARSLEVVLLDFTARSMASTRRVPSVQHLAPILMRELFEAPYSRGAFFHLYNVDVVERLDLPLGWTILPLSREDAALLLNESTLTSRLHFEQAGTAFLFFRDLDTGDTWEWLQDRWLAATFIVRVLKFLRPGIVDLDWASFHYLPDWVVIFQNHSPGAFPKHSTAPAVVVRASLRSHCRVSKSFLERGGNLTEWRPAARAVEPRRATFSGQAISGYPPCGPVLLARA